MGTRRIEIDMDRLRVLYVDEKKSFVACSEALGCSTGVIRKRLKELNIKSRGNTEWSIGCHLSPEHKAKLRASRLGKPLSVETRAKIGAHFRGKTLTEEHKRKIGLAYKGMKHPCRDQFGEKNPNWTGGLSEFYHTDLVIQECRRVVKAAKKKGQIVARPCEICGIFPARAHHDDYEKPLDVRWLCPSHHKKFHMRHRFKEYRYVPIGETDGV